MELIVGSIIVATVGVVGQLGALVRGRVHDTPRARKR